MLPFKLTLNIMPSPFEPLEENCVVVSRKSKLWNNQYDVTLMILEESCKQILAEYVHMLGIWLVNKVLF